MRDTTPAADAIVHAAVLRVPRAERLRQALELSEQMRTLALTLELVELMLGVELVPRSALTNKR